MSLLLALCIDWFCGEPPVRFHPVVWMGNYLKWAGQGLTTLSPRVAFMQGGLYWILGASITVLVYGLLGLMLRVFPYWLEIFLLALLLKPLLSFKMLLDEVQAVETALQQSLEQGRKRLSYIVSPNTSQLSDVEVRESALESLAENLSDSVIVPLFWYALLGLPGAALYRFANTADAMWGYRNQWEWAGKIAARADDVFNFIPARITALFLFPRVFIQLAKAAQLLKESQRTPSPNGGYPMSALALYLGVRLSKPKVYSLNAYGQLATAQDVMKALQLCTRVAWGFAILSAFISYQLYGI